MKKILILAFVLILQAECSFAKDVIYNKRTNKFHDTDCHLTKKCTNCETIDIDKAFEIKADPCEICRTSDENFDDKLKYKRKKLEEQKEQAKKAKGYHKYGNYSYTVK